MQYRLCLALGVTHPSRLDLTYREFLDWVEYYGEEPFGELRADFRSAAQTLYIAGMWSEDEGLPNLVYPYFEDDSPEAMQGRATKIDEWIAQRYGNKHLQNLRDNDSGHPRASACDGEVTAADRQD